MSQSLNIETVDLPLRPVITLRLLNEDVFRVEELVRRCNVTLSLCFLSLWLLLDNAVLLFLVDFSNLRADRLPRHRSGAHATTLGEG